MSRIALVTSDVPLLRDEEVHWIAQALTRRGEDAEVLPWDAGDHWARFDLVVVRTPWDYFGRLDQFLAWTRDVAEVTRLVNPPEVIAWNSHKGYLADLQERGLPVLPSLRVDRGSADVPAAVRDCGWDLVVVKAAVDGGGFKIRRGLSTAPDLQAFAAGLAADEDVIVQPYASGIEAGERSLVFFGGELSHAVRKVPSRGEYRSQRHHGGAELVHSPSDAELALAVAAMAAAPGELAYARADLIEQDGQPVLMELEVIEPDLFLRSAPGATERFASVLSACA